MVVFCWLWFGLMGLLGFAVFCGVGIIQWWCGFGGLGWWLLLVGCVLLALIDGASGLFG